LQHRDKPRDFIDRLSCHEIESRVESGVRDFLKIQKKMADVLGFEIERDQSLLRAISENEHLVPTRRLIREGIEKIEIDREQLTIHIRAEKLKQVLAEELKLYIRHDSPESIKTIEVPFMTWRAHRHVTMVEEEKSGASRDIFDLPANELKNLIRGIVWRDRHFEGMTIRQIADKESFSEAFVGKCISRSFDVLQGR
jgi:site-specific DNA recombinase